jgi:hypothetical protein
MDRQKTPTDWPLELRVAGGETKRGAKFYGTRKQLAEHLKMLNGVGSGGTWGIDRYQLPEGA